MEKPTFLIENKTLRAEIARPRALYNEPRFDQAGIVVQVTLEGRDRFCGAEKEGGAFTEGGIGLCGEFGIDGALGYDEAGPGIPALKIGVGLIHKPDASPYVQNRDYAFSPVAVTCQAEGSGAVFSVSQPTVGGYAYAYEKNITLRENRLCMRYCLTNTGEKDIVTTHYEHNFLRFNEWEINGEYSLQLDNADWLGEKGMCEYPLLCGEGEPSTILFGDVTHEEFYLRKNHPAQLTRWALRHRKTGLAVTETLSAPACRFSVWGFNRVVCPEMFIALAVPVGQTREWGREYVFGDTGLT